MDQDKTLESPSPSLLLYQKSLLGHTALEQRNDRRASCLRAVISLRWALLQVRAWQCRKWNQNTSPLQKLGWLECWPLYYCDFPNEELKFGNPGENNSSLKKPMLACTLYFKSCEWRIWKSNPSFLTVKTSQISALHPFTQCCSAYVHYFAYQQEGNLRKESLKGSIDVFVHKAWFSSLPSCGSDETLWTNAPCVSKTFIWLSGYSSSEGKPKWEPKPRT